MEREERIYSELFQKIGRKLMLKANQDISSLGLNGQQGRVIGYIARHEDEGIIQKDLAEVFNRRGASVTSMLQGLEKKGYIERKIQEGNERQKRLYVLPKGKELIGEFETVFNKVEKELTDVLSDEEKETLLKLLNKIDENI
ncbi:MAG: MarR family winged helix-turn-helix transcriptional regulator [Sarcina sp.]